MKNDPRTERAFGNLIEREHKRKNTVELENAYTEILRLRRKQTGLLGCIDILLQETPDNLTLRLSEVVEKYKNEY
jgi:hypothetical protein